MRRFLLRLTNLFRSRQAEREIARELDSHLSLLRDDFERRGLSARAADRAARLALGGIEQTKELHRDARAFVWIEQFLHDIRYAWRNLMRSPGFTLVAAAALALGLAANASVFAIYNAIVLKPLPIADPGRVVRLKRWFARSPDDASRYAFSNSEFQYLRDRSATFSAVMAAYDEDGTVSVLASIGGAAAQEHLDGRLVSAGYFTGLGVPARIGRTFRPEEDRSPGGNPVMILSYRFWQRRFHGDPNVVGETIKLNGLPFVVAGVAPEKFSGADLFPLRLDFWAPLSMRRQLAPTPASPADHSASGPGPRELELLARLKDGVTRDQAQAETGLLLRRYLAAFHESEPTTAVTLHHYDVLVMLAVAAVASAIPARRATRVDPMIALRHE